MKGAKATPKLLKVLHGNPGKRSLKYHEPEGQGELWQPPDWFDDRQREQWHYSLEYASPGLLSATDREVMVLWVCAAVEHRRAAQEIRKHGQVIRTREGNMIQNPFLGVMNRQAVIMLRAAGELGFSPSARASLGNRAPDFNPHSPTPQPSRLTAYLARKPDRLDS